MAPIVLDEVNVFTFPHSRMRKLMNCCTSKVGHTDFTSLNDFEQLLIRLQRTFTEFMAHEEIENHFVMKKLKNKLKQQSTINDTELICNCHTIDRFSPLMSLFQDGYAFIRRGNADRMSYGVKLHKAMIHFYEDFLPHMHEEENDIQPLLFKYFTEMELKLMRIEVIKMTLQKRENSTKNPIYQIERPLKIYVISYHETFSNNILQNILKHLTNKQLKESCLTVNKQWNTCVSKVLKQRSPICQLPNEIFFRLFRYYLNPYDLFISCSRVNHQWKKLMEDSTIWKIVNPINWARGEWNSNIPSEYLSHQDNLDELKEKEISLINGLIKSFLPNFGSAIENLILYGSLTINDNTARKIFDLCPNLKHLNIGMTRLTSKAFVHFRWINSLQSFILEGCELLDDSFFDYLISSMIFFSPPYDQITIEDKQQCAMENLCTQLNPVDRLSLCSQRFSKPSKKFQLQILNLSGCYRFTDYSINLLIRNGFNESLKYIDFSGCTQISSDCILSLIRSSPLLKMENLFLCDNLQSSSLAAANCCRNVENSSGRYCCRC